MQKMVEVRGSTGWYTEDPAIWARVMFEPEGIIWEKLTPVIHVSERIRGRFNEESLKAEVERVREAHAFPIDRVDVMAYQWVWDENFVSLKVQFWYGARGFAMVYSIGEEAPYRLVPFRGGEEF